MSSSNDKQGIRIFSIQANSIYYVNNGIKIQSGQAAFLNLGDAVMPESLFVDYMRRHGVTVNKKNRSLDFVSISFDDGVIIMDEEDREKGFKNIRASTLRKDYYTNGVTVTWKSYDKNGNEKMDKRKTIHYKMLMRSPGKAKKGDCIFIRGELYNKAMEFLSMSLASKLPEKNAKIVEMSAYQTLTTAAAIDYINITLENVLIVEDEKVAAEGIKTVSVKTKKVPYTVYNIDYEATEPIINEIGFTFYPDKTKNSDLKHIKRSKLGLHENGITEYVTRAVQKEKSVCYVDREGGNAIVENTLWDGMGIIDETIFPAGMDGFIYCRNHFFKACLFRGNIQQYFRDFYGDAYDTATVRDMFGNEKKVKNIKVITTDNAVKWLKFVDLMGGSKEQAYKYYKEIVETYDNKFAILKTGHQSKYGDLQRSSYQINNSLPCTDREVLAGVAKTSIDYINGLKTDYDLFLKHLQSTTHKYKINNVLLALATQNENFRYTQYFKDKRNAIISEFKKERVQLGKLLLNGDNLTLCGNPIALLMKVTGENFCDDPCFTVRSNGVECYTTRFEDGAELAGFRNPHNSPNNIVHFINTYSDTLTTYFPKLGDNVIVVNGIGTDIQQRLNGMDFDSDYVFVTDQTEMVVLAEQAYTKYPTIINDIKLLDGSKYRKDMLSYAKMDNKIKAAQYAIGNSSNIAQLALSYYYDGGHDNTQLEDVFIICSVLAQCAIDSAKRTYDINITQEIERLKTLECMQAADEKMYPVFYAEILRTKDKKFDEAQVRQYDCPMDLLAEIVDEGVVDKRGYKKYKEPKYHLRTVFEYKRGSDKASKQRKDIIAMIEAYDSLVKSLDARQEDYHEKVSRAFDDCLDKMKNIMIKPSTMAFLIAYAFAPNGGVKDRLLVSLYNHDKETFLDCFKKNENCSHKTAEIPNKIA